RADRRRAALVVPLPPPETADAQVRVRPLEQALDRPGVLPPGRVVAPPAAGADQRDDVEERGELRVLDLVRERHRHAERAGGPGGPDTAERLARRRAALAVRRRGERHERPGDRADLRGRRPVVPDQQAPPAREQRLPLERLAWAEPTGE